MSLQENRKQDKGKIQPTRFHFLASRAAKDEDVERIKGFACGVDESVRVLELLDSASDVPERCIYVTDCASGVSGMDIAPVLEITGVSSWLIVICGMKGRRGLAEFSVLRDTWELKVGLLEASVSIIADDGNCRESIRKWIQRECEMGDHGRICLLASSRERVGRSYLRKCLEKQPASKGWQFEEKLIQDKDYISIRDAASRVVFIGSELNDFTIPYYDGGLRKSIFFLNKCDVQPVCFDDAAGARKSILEILRNDGWDLSDVQSRQIYIGSALYGSFYAGLQSKSLSFQNLLAREDFAMWDEYLLPAARETYSLEQVMTFLRSCDCITDMSKYLFSKGKADDKIVSKEGDFNG